MTDQATPGGVSATSNGVDVLVVGGGNAGLCAATSAAEAGARVLLVDKAGEDWAGGNTYFTAGAIRTTFDGLDDLRPLLDGLTDEQARLVDLPAYRPADFLADLRRVTHGRADPELADLLAGQTRPAVEWLAGHGVALELMFHRQAYRVGGRFRFWGGLAVGVVGGGKGLVAAETAAASSAGVEIRQGTAVISLLPSPETGVAGVVVAGSAGRVEIPARSVVLCCGGFEANPRMRAAYLGPGWDLAAVRGTPYNTGEGITMALAAGAQAWGHWSGCHAVAWDAGAGPSGDRVLTNQLTRNSYPVGIMVNRRGERFVDEGADFRNYTYARYGREILAQPGGVAYQVFDAKSVPLLRPEEYASPGATKVEADTLAELAGRLGIDPDVLSATVTAYNAAVTHTEFDPSVKDGKHTEGVNPPKSNWALPVAVPPLVAYPVTCGITFTFGGLRVDREARVLDTAGRPVPGLYAAGETVGGVFYHNYPGGSGLALGAVLGRVAGAGAARFAAAGPRRSGRPGGAGPGTHP